MNSSNGSAIRTDKSGWEAVADMVRQAKGGDARVHPGARSFEQLARLARNLPGAPTFEGEDIRKLVGREGGMFNYGGLIRSVMAASGVPLVHVLEPAGWWPDMRWGAGISPVERVAEGCRLMGVEAEIRHQGNRIVLRLA